MAEKTLRISKIVVLLNYGTDRISVYTDDMPPFPIYPDEKLVLRFEVPAGNGVAYVTVNFPDAPIEVIDAKTGEREKIG